jgi:transcriptional regulator with XRE-family HTH domain
MATISSQPRVGPLLREWRKRRRRTQLEVALDAGVSARHLSFVETGRSTPSPEMVLRLAEQLEVPVRERNQLLLAAGYAPAIPEYLLADPQLAPVREALNLILAGHDLTRRSSSTAAGTSSPPTLRWRRWPRGSTRRSWRLRST